MKITIQTIPHSDQRYDTVGDWIFDAQGNLEITVSEMGNDNFAFLVGIHEAIEAWLCRHDGVKEEDVSAFDQAFEGAGEPGDDPDAPYREQHFIATSIERILSQAIDVDWADYGTAVDAL